MHFSSRKPLGNLINQEYLKPSNQNNRSSQNQGQTQQFDSSDSMRHQRPRFQEDCFLLSQEKQNKINLNDRQQSMKTTSQKVMRKLSFDDPKDFYTQAKRAEYLERNLTKAETLYRKAIVQNQRVESAIKDLATVLHQQGKTKEACTLLQQNREVFIGQVEQLEQYENLLRNLQKQICPSGKCYNKNLMIMGLEKIGLVDQNKIRDLFSNNSRIISVQFFEDLSFSRELEQIHQKSSSSALSCSKSDIYTLLNFSSYSAAKKTYDSLKEGKYLDQLEFFWVNVDNKIVSKTESPASLEGQKGVEKKEDKVSFPQQNKLIIYQSCWNELLMFDNDWQDEEGTAQVEPHLIDNQLSYASLIKDLEFCWSPEDQQQDTYLPSGLSRKIHVQENQFQLELIKEIQNRQIVKSY